MSTRSNIVVRLKNGSWKRIYCHSDGYLSWNGRKLIEHYNSQEMAEALVTMGDLSFLGNVIGEKHEFEFYSTFSKKHNNNYEALTADPEYQRLSNMCRFYHRDRGESDANGTIGDSLESVWGEQEYLYVWTGEKWMWTFPESYDEKTEKFIPNSPDTLRDLAPVIAVISSGVDDEEEAIAKAYSGNLPALSLKELFLTALLASAPIDGRPN